MIESPKSASSGCAMAWLSRNGARWSILSVRYPPTSRPSPASAVKWWPMRRCLPHLPPPCSRSCAARYSLRTTRVSIMRFCAANFAGRGVAYSAEALCTVKLSRRLFPEHARHNLDAVMERHCLELQRPTSRAGRCPGAAGLVGQVAREIPADIFAAAAAQAMLTPPKLPAQLAAGAGR